MIVKTLKQEMEERQENCVTLKDWLECYEWMTDMKKQNEEDLEEFKEAIVQKYGREAFDKIEKRGLEIYDEMSKQRGEELFNDMFFDEAFVKDYGFTQEGIVPIKGGLALGSLNAGTEVLVLKPDNTYEVVHSEEEMRQYQDEGYFVFGVKESELEKDKEDGNYGR